MKNYYLDRVENKVVYRGKFQEPTGKGKYPDNLMDFIDLSKVGNKGGRYKDYERNIEEIERAMSEFK
jgi:hypothetical protein